LTKLKATNPEAHEVTVAKSYVVDNPDVPNVGVAVQPVILVSAPDAAYASDVYLNANVLETNEAANPHDLHSFTTLAKKNPEPHVIEVITYDWLI